MASAGRPGAPLAVPVEAGARIAAVIAVGDPIGDLATARDDLERLGRALGAASGASPGGDPRVASRRDRHRHPRRRAHATLDHVPVEGEFR